MKIMQSKWILGFLCSMAGAGAVLAAQRFYLSESDHPFFRMEEFFDESADPIFKMQKMHQGMLRGITETFELSHTDHSVNRREDGDYVYYDVSVSDPSKEKLNVRVEDGQIIISSRAQSEKNDSDWRSSFSSSFYRSFPAPDDVNTEKVQVEAGNGKMILKFPKIKT